MPRTVSIGKAKAYLSRLIARAEAGKDVVNARGGVPVERSIAETIALLRQERARRLRVSTATIRTAKDQGRA